jgi:PhnB protein
VAAATDGDLGMPAEAPGTDTIVFGQLENDGGFRLMAYGIPGHDTTDTSRMAGNTRRENGATITDRTFFQYAGSV